MTCRYCGREIRYAEGPRAWEVPDGYINKSGGSSWFRCDARGEADHQPIEKEDNFDKLYLILKDDRN